MEQHLGLIISLLSLLVSALLAYSYLQIRLSLAEQILQVLNGRYLKKDLADMQFKSVEEHIKTANTSVEAKVEALGSALHREVASISKGLASLNENGCMAFRTHGLEAPGRKGHPSRRGEESSDDI